MSKTLQSFVLLFATAYGNPLCCAAEFACATEARDRAKHLIVFHAGADDRVAIDDLVTRLPAMRNPENPKQRFDVLQVWGHIYKGRYRMRFIFYNSSETRCLLLGQEILEFARP
jgi:hypothetical protein